MNEEKIAPQEHLDRSVDDEMAQEFTAMLDTEGYTPEELYRAYMVFTGVEDGVPDERISKLAKEMESMADKGFPINRFVQLYDLTNEVQYAVSDFEKLVQQLDISDREKVTLHSIVQQQRAGTLTLEDQSGEEIAAVEITPGPRATAEIVALRLYKALESMGDNLMSVRGIVFEER